MLFAKVGFPRHACSQLTPRILHSIAQLHCTDISIQLRTQEDKSYKGNIVLICLVLTLCASKVLSDH